MRFLAVITGLTHLSLVSHKGLLANSVDPDQTSENATFDQGLHCLQELQKFLQSMKHVIIKTNQTPLIQASSVDPDQTPQNAASDQGLHCLH